ncbi:MAG: hypothetical protein ACRDSJ_17735, partial [Rubrobacteraceae bacterium]
IQESSPGARVLILLREPVGRAFSHYLMDVYAGRQSLPFHEALERDYAKSEKGWGSPTSTSNWACTTSRYRTT